MGGDQKGKACENSDHAGSRRKKRKAMVSFHANILIKEDNENICILIFLGRFSVCLEARHNLFMLPLNWLITSPPLDFLLIILRSGATPHHSWLMCDDLMAVPTAKESWDRGPAGGKAGGHHWPVGMQEGNRSKNLEKVRGKGFTHPSLPWF